MGHGTIERPGDGFVRDTINTTVEVSQHDCKNCGAAIDLKKSKCDYCDSPFIIVEKTRPAKPGPSNTGGYRPKP